MPRNIPVSNGNILVCFDQDYYIRDLYFPRIGQENHSDGNLWRFGLWVDGKFSWLNSSQWEKSLAYKKKSIVTKIELTNSELGIKIYSSDCIDCNQDIFIRNLQVYNLDQDQKRNHRKHIKVFFHQDYRIYQTEIGNTGFYDPKNKTVVHYKGKRYFLINLTDGIENYSIGVTNLGTAEGTWRDAEDGELQNTPVSHGSVDSTIGKYFYLKPAQTYSFDYWICFGKNLEQVKELNKNLIRQTPQARINLTNKFWELSTDLSSNFTACLPDWVKKLYKRSLLIIRTQIDKRGAILAANDSSVQKDFKDHYSYMWPRDGALVCYSLDLAGYKTITQRFLELICGCLSLEGFLKHKYRPDATLASSWHPYVRNNQAQLPIQQDGTALVLWALKEHFEIHKDAEFMVRIYDSCIKKMADFLYEYRDPRTKLPRASFDLWEERHGVFTFTCSVVEAALRAAGKLCQAFGDQDNYLKYSLASQEIKENIKKHLFNQETNSFLRGLITPEQNQCSQEFIKDTTIDSSVYALFRFGTFSVDDPMIKSTLDLYRSELKVKTKIGGYARYKSDWYQHQVKPNQEIPGNPWIISTLWLMIADIYASKNLKELEQTLDSLRWIEKISAKSGILPEQVNPFDGSHLSVSPLTWSHSTVIEAISLYLKKKEQLSF